MELAGETRQEARGIRLRASGKVNYSTLGGSPVESPGICEGSAILR